MITCPLCGRRFEACEARKSCASCKLLPHVSSNVATPGCSMTCCPGCGYTFPTGSVIVRFFKNLFGGTTRDARNDRRTS